MLWRCRACPERIRVMPDVWKTDLLMSVFCYSAGWQINNSKLGNMSPKQFRQTRRSVGFAWRGPGRLQPQQIRSTSKLRFKTEGVGDRVEQHVLVAFATNRGS